MPDDYLDISRSVMISSPAGSGKTEKLARRYIALLRGGSDVERILAITFTDKAAAEMKERVLDILRREDGELFNTIRPRIPRMRISTIHSFCMKLLKRFSLELGMDPSLAVMDGFASDTLWSEAIYESLREEDLKSERLFFEIIRDKGIKGWNKVYTVLHELHGKRPAIELGLRKSAMRYGHPEAGYSLQNSDAGPGSASGETTHTERLVDLYGRCLDRYTRKKRERHLLDYNDLEILAYEAVSGTPEWQNVLFSFDEHTDHVLVDEFQDTSSLQWRIIDKLTEEWRAGMGAKRDRGTKPTIFLVGDEKQSIYSFRGANVGIFKEVRRRLAEWLGEEYHFVQVKENYRSLPAIIRFVNVLFDKLMPRGLYDDWRIEYVPFEATRQGEGAVEFVIHKGETATKEGRKEEAGLIAQRITDMHGSYEIHADGLTRPCSYGDMAILLRSRTHLPLFEDALRRRDIPFVVVKGVGFYDTPEVAVLRALLFFLIDPKDDYSLFTVLRSPLFRVDYSLLIDALKERSREDAAGGSIFEFLSGTSGERGDYGPVQIGLWEKRPDARQPFDGMMKILAHWRERGKDVSYSVLIEDILCETRTWEFFGETQRYLNVKKFIGIIEEFERTGLAPLEIREKLIKASDRSDEPKANVNSEVMDAVKVMTVHASKGLQFPVVFLPCLDEESAARSSSPVVLEEEADCIYLAYEEDSEIRKTLPVFQRQRERSEDEEKRLFYVAATRAMDFLYLSGIMREKPRGKLAYLFDSFDLHGEEIGRQSSTKGLPFAVRVVDAGSGKAVSERLLRTEKKGRVPERTTPQRDGGIFIESIDKDYKPAKRWLDVTEEIGFVRRRHGQDWVVLGRAFHRLFEGLSRGTLSTKTVETKISDILRNETLSDSALERMRGIIIADLVRLEQSGYLQDIILAADNAYAELPFVLQKGDRIYRGRVDRLIIREGVAHLYDYKTYPVSEKEIPELCERYAFQMNLYREAVERIFSLRTASHLFFTHLPRLVALSEN